MENPKDNGSDLLGWAKDLYPITRSLTGAGVRETLKYLGGLVPGLQVHEVPSGTKVLDWTVPKEWSIRSAYIETLEGERVVDMEWSNLHVMGYSIPIDEIVSREELEDHLYSLPEQPTAIPYVTSYYSENWGFCLTQLQRDSLKEEQYRVKIDSELFEGSLTYAELIIPGTSSDEVLLSTYVCHPSMVNNELSGPVVMAGLARWLQNNPGHKYTYRIIFIAETIGAITYLSKNIDTLQRKVKAGWVLTCIGDDRIYSYVPSRLGGTLADRVSLKVLEERGFPFKKYSFLDRGSDERQWCAPGVDLPVCSLMRSKYAEYPEYHTSLDDFSVVTEAGLQGGLDMMKDCIELLENNEVWQVTTLGEPQLGKRGLYPNTSTKASTGLVRNMTNQITYSDGNHDVIQISDLIGVNTSEVIETAHKLADQGLLILARNQTA